MDVKCATCKHAEEKDAKEPCVCWDCSDYEYYEPDENIKQLEITETKQPDFVNHPPHYQACSIECFDIMYMMFGGEWMYSYCIINAYKYMHRYKHKNGKEDLEKAEWYLNKANEIARKGDVIEYEHAQEMGEVLRKLKGAYEHEETKS